MFTYLLILLIHISSFICGKKKSLDISHDLFQNVNEHVHKTLNFLYNNTIFFTLLQYEISNSTQWPNNF